MGSIELKSSTTRPRRHYSDNGDDGDDEDDYDDEDAADDDDDDDDDGGGGGDGGDGVAAGAAGGGWMQSQFTSLSKRLHDIIFYFFSSEVFDSVRWYFLGAVNTSQLWRTML